jgi:excinuclease ABC subunit C
MRPSDKITQTLKLMPDEPGVYIMKDSGGLVIYVGKAARLKKRVSSYFQKKIQDRKTEVLVRNISELEYIVTDSEMEALILESNLVKRHKPRFNIRLKDDKRFPYIAVTMGDEYPRVIYTRRVGDRTSRYFGPYTDARAARAMAYMVSSIFKLRTCRKELPLKKGERPCLNHQMRRCSGACTGHISREEYMELVDNALHFLEGNIEPVLAGMNRAMRLHSEKLDFEKAARIRDIIFDVQRMSERQLVSIGMGQDQDYLNVGIFGAEALLVLFEFRKGVLLGRKINVFENTDLSEPRDIVRTFILDYYQHAEIPGRIITDYSVEDREVIEDFLTARASKKVQISQPGTGDDRGILDMIKKNIDIIAADRQAARAGQDMEAGMALLKEALSLKSPPEEIVCFDISNLQGTDAVASMVSFRSGYPDRTNYRRFRIRGHEGPNDPAMIHEAVARRIQHLVNEGLPMPDLMVIDGGPTQLTRAMEAASNFDADVKIVSLAKRFEEIYFSPGEEPLRLDKNSPALKLLQALRDEAHRFAVTYHRNIRDRKFTGSELDEIPGIGGVTRRALLRHFGSMEEIKKADVSRLGEVDGIGESTARRIYDYYHNND